ncbi:hypothetical protein Agub_g7054, partial [Astrephomene gubernaculifera]
PFMHACCPRRPQVALRGLRPSFPPQTPPDFRRLAERCWQADPRSRPTFEAVLAELQRMSAAFEAAAASANSRAASAASKRRSPLLWTAGGGGGGGTGGGGGYWDNAATFG